DESPPDIVVADNSEFERKPRGVCKADCSWNARVRNGDHHVCIGRRLLCKLLTGKLSQLIYIATFHDGIRPREVDILENAEPTRLLLERIVGLDAVLGDDDDLTRSDIPHEFGADDIECAGFRGKNVSVVELAKNKRAHAPGIPH